tara:strand:+ start:70 stop:780 length:711 start_codon:yes stop_codon:yes gene_type:complete
MRGLTLLLPTLDEAAALANVIGRIPRDAIENNGYQLRVVVVDGGSTDGTEQIAQSLDCEIIRQVSGRGKGNGLREAFHRFIQTEDDLLVLMDADGTYRPEEIVNLLEHLESSNVEIVIGSRMKGIISPGAMTRRNYIGNRILTWLAVVLYSRYVSDLCTGFWAFERSAIEKMRLNSTGFEIEAEMYTSAIHERIQMGEIPIHYDPRIGRSKLGSIRDGIRIAMKLLKRRFVHHPRS